MPTSRELKGRAFQQSEGFTAREIADVHKPPSGFNFDEILGNGLPAGFQPLDKLARGGFKKGELVLIVAGTRRIEGC